MPLSAAEGEGIISGRAKCRTGESEADASVSVQLSNSPILQILLYCRKIYASLFRLTAQIFCLQLIPRSIFYEVCSALPELKTDILTNTLLPNGQNPVIIKGSCAVIRLTADYDKFDIIKILFNINSFE